MIESTTSPRPSLTVAGLAVAIALAATACGGPSINAAAKADIDRRAAALQPSSRAVETPSAGEPKPLAAGQWIVVEQTDDKKQPSFIKYSIVAEEAGAYWIEISNDSYYGHSATRMLVAFGDRRDPASFEVRYMASKHTDGRVEVVPEPLLRMMRSTYSAALENLIIRWQQMPQEDASVVAGKFTGCFKGRSTVSFAGFSATSDVWWHSEVPINGLVKSVGVDKPMTTELIDYGFEGATSEF
jgi:hypothetical protein